MERYYYYNGRAVEGPYTLGGMQDLFSEYKITSQTPVNREGEAGWKTLAAFCDTAAIQMKIPRTVKLSFHPDVRKSK